MIGQRSPSRYVPLIPACLLLASCTTVRGPIPLSEKQLGRLEARMQSHTDLGITLSPGPALQNNASISDAGDGMQKIDMLTPGQGGASLRRGMYQVNGALIRIQVNGKTAIALVDTGASHTLADYPGTLRTHITPVANPYAPTPPQEYRPLLTARSRGLGGEADYYLGVIRELCAGDVCVSSFPVWILNDSRGVGAGGWMEGYRVENILGYDFVSMLDSVTFDYVNEHLITRIGTDYTPDPKRHLASTDLRTVNGLPRIMASVDGGREIPFVVDTGGFFGMWIPRNLAASLKMSEIESEQQVGMGAGPGGQTVYRSGTHALTIGGHTIRNVPTAVSLLNYGDKEPEFGLIGNGLLRRFDMTLDIGKGQLHLESQRR